MTILSSEGSSRHSITIEDKKRLLIEILEKMDSLRKVLIIPPDFSRFHSGAGEITQILYELLPKKCQIDIIPALGTHSPMTDKQIALMFGNIPIERFIIHNWRNDVIKIGEIPYSFIKEVSFDELDYSINVDVNRILIDGNYDMVFSIGQVVPHEVAGMANENKNIFVGLGGVDMINKSHFLGAMHGIEHILGQIDTPVREVFNYAEERFLVDIPITYILTVSDINESGNLVVRGFFSGDDHEAFKQAARLSQEVNINILDESLEKIVVYLDPDEYKSTWLGNKAIYRTRMAIADEGHLIILSPGLKKFGEDKVIDQLIRKHGYVTKREILKLVKNKQDLRNNLSVVAHLIHGSSEGRFQVKYCPKHVSKEEITNVNYLYGELHEIMKRYDPKKLVDGYNELDDGEKIFFISNPATGLWTVRDKFNPINQL
ncbi:MAG: lactate racemase domain-containing protein [Candidatus Hodarchaeales archaeon]